MMGKAWPQRALNRRFIPHILQTYKQVLLLFFLHKLRKDLYFFYLKVFNEDHDVMFFPSLEGTLVREPSVSAKTELRWHLALSPQAYAELKPLPNLPSCCCML